MRIEDQVPIWNAINEYANSCGADQAIISDRRMNAVVKVNQEIEGHLRKELNDFIEAAHGWSIEKEALRARIVERFTAPIVCICGSTRFKQAWIAENARLTGEGNIVLAVGLWGHHERVFPDAETKKRLDELHLRKIDLCDWVWVLDVGGYIGESTRNEIRYANDLGKPVRYLSNEFPDYVEPVDPMIALMKVAVVAERYLHGLLLEEETTTAELREAVSEWRNTP